MSPEKDDEKPIYESSEGPIPKRRGKPGKSNMVNSGESFGISAIRSSGLGQRPA